MSAMDFFTYTVPANTEIQWEFWKLFNGMKIWKQSAYGKCYETWFRVTIRPQKY